MVVFVSGFHSEKKASTFAQDLNYVHKVGDGIAPYLKMLEKFVLPAN